MQGAATFKPHPRHPTEPNPKPLARIFPNPRQPVKPHLIEPPRVHILGASSARPSPNRDHSSMVVDFGGDLTLVDCSANPIGKILRLGLDPFEVGRVLVTHAHPDHTYGFPSVIYSLMTHPPIRTKPLAVHAPKRPWTCFRIYGAPTDSVTPISLSPSMWRFTRSRYGNAISL